jgi:nucleoside-diphosphate-sugar epimerase
LKILVIGNGFLATPIIKLFESEGNHVLVYSRSRSEGIQSTQVLGSVFNFEDFRRVLTWKPEVIIHTAWITDHETHRFDLSNYDYAEFTSALAKEISNSEVKHLIVLGSCVEYGLQNKPVVAGTTKLLPLDTYAQQKVQAFKLAKEVLQNSTVRLTWARVFYAYGPGQDKLRLLPYLINELRAERVIHLRDTTSVLDWVTTRDVARAISFLVHNPTPTEVDIGTTFGYTNLQVLESLQDLLGSQKQSKVNSSEFPKEGHVYVVGEKSPLINLGWEPQDTLTSGLEWVLNS